MGVNECLPQFVHINRFWDRHGHYVSAKILPGEYYVTRNDECISTVLGSCISVCVYDLKAGVGGMNHFMLPGGKGADLQSESFRYGDVAMERMLNDMYKVGAKRENLKFKAFGGAQVIRIMTDIGKSNIAFLHKFLTLEGFRLISSDLGDKYPRKVKFFPQTGQVLMKKLEHMHNDTITQREVSYRAKLATPVVKPGDVELFD
ncbi:chemoreceptor glutamine deamidase CheD [Aestuariibacter halophilus]|uniref:Probable chemoreceptor glutamine deamidase CheD n=1 Tax=Fluctibacter halophilus TaxID=226011 RepID=A0ABS8G8L2_9ALTE|nr:chemoreceptor glutamine deamidase CheD [Aestuariibacter halophilus]MCC2616029.1 chemoreceptor glutamine deamidase CheD [Aestuariibacter halophilus]